MSNLFYLGKLICSLFLGVVFGKFSKEKYLKKAVVFQSVILYALLFFMGVNIGSIEGILGKLNTIGFQALLVTLFNLGGTIVVATIAALLITRKENFKIDKLGNINLDAEKLTTHDINEKYGTVADKGLDLVKKHKLLRILLTLREPFILVMIVMFGMLLRVFTPLFSWFDSSIITYLLYGLLFFSGVNVVSSNLKLKDIFASPWLLLLPLWTVLGTYLGALFLPFVTKFSVSEALGLSSGFAWYSLSGIMITDLGFPYLGSISFLSNIFRESMTFLLIPILARFGRKYYYPAVCCGGASTMDVTLFMLTSHFGPVVMVSSMYHGIVMTLLVPFMIPLFF